MTAPFDSPQEVAERLAALDHVTDEGLAHALHLATTLSMPLLLEGEPGVGKTSAATSLAAALQTRLIRLQCYEGLGPHEALYEWNYPRQLLAIRLAESGTARLREVDLFTADYLEERPLLASLRHAGDRPAVLLIDEIDRADDEFEALLLEFLGEGAVTIPEIGTITAERRPIVVLTSNRSRELHDALRRRCLYHWLTFPEPAQVAEILRRRVPGAREPLITSAVAAVERIRALDLEKAPGLAEAIDWVRALTALGVSDIDGAAMRASLGTLVKTPDDIDVVLHAEPPA